MSNSLDQSYIKIYKEYAKLSMRERVILLSATLGIILFLGSFLFIEPAWTQLQKDKKQNIAISRGFASLDQQIMQLEEKLRQDPDQRLKQQIQSLKAENSKLDARVVEQTSDLVAASQMTRVLENLLAESGGLKLISLESLSPTLLHAKPDDEESLGLYQHGVKLVLEGDYFSIQQYLESIETAPWQFYWKRFDYEVIEHPKAQVELELYTLSTNEAFIDV